MSLKIHPMLHRMPAPVLRVWAFMITHHPDGYVGTPGRLHREMKADEARVGRHTMVEALDMLHDGGMVEIDRQGHYLSVRLVGDAG